MTLKETIDNMLREAEQTRQPARRRLPMGLMIAILLNGKTVEVQLSRGDIYPSLLEWKTVLQQWPGHVTVTRAPKALVQSNQYFLKGQIRVQEKLV